MNYTGVAVVRRSDDELKHFKYIKREKKNGKWVYYYDTKSLKNDVKDALGYDEREARDKAVKENNKALAKAEYAKEQLNKVKAGVASGEYFDKDNGNDSIIAPYQEAYNKAVAERDAAGDKAIKAVQSYAKTPLGRLDQAKETINAGKSVVSDLLYGLGKNRGTHRPLGMR